jgi:hypothetical protein
MNYFYMTEGRNPAEGGKIQRQISPDLVRFELMQWDLDEGDIDSWFETPTKFACKVSGWYVVTSNDKVRSV